MYGYEYKRNISCCKNFKNFLKLLSFLGNLTGFILLCILVKFSSNDDLDDIGTIHGLSVASLIVIICYIILSVVLVILMSQYRYSSESIAVLGLALIVLLLWIARYVLFVILIHNIESYQIEKYDDEDDYNKLKNCFRGFAILQIIIDAIGQIDNIIPEED